MVLDPVVTTGCHLRPYDNQAGPDILESLITCRAAAWPRWKLCRPTPAILYECSGCGATLRRSRGDCCVFCSFGSVPCPPIQAVRSGGREAVMTTKPLKPRVMLAKRRGRARWLGGSKVAIVAAIFAPIVVRGAVDDRALVDRNGHAF